MKSLRLKKYIIILLSMLTAVCIAAFTGLHFGTALADDRLVTISGSTIFYTSGGAQVWSHRETAETSEDADAYYTMFVFTEEGNSVNYRRNLAYAWYYDANAGDEDAPTAPAAGYLNMEIGFEQTDFEKFILTFETQQYSETKDGKTTNYVIFAPAGEGSVRVLVTDDIDASVPEEGTEGAVTVDADHIKLSLDENGKAACYTVTVNGTEAGWFENVGGTYAKYVSSTTDPVTPLSFKAVFAEENSVGAGKAYMALYSLNGQSFKLSATPSESGGHYVSGRVVDNAPPVLCLDSNLSFVEIGEEIGFNYTVIDVLASSPSTTTSYFMLSKAQAADAQFNADDYGDDALYREVTDSDNQYMIPHADSYLPSGSDVDASVFDGKNLTAEAAVKVAVKLTDTTATGGLSDTVLLDWYVGAEYAVNVNGNRYLAVADDTVGAAYAYTDDATETSATDSAAWQQLLADYQAKVDEAAKDLKAGNKNYFYLPTAEELFADNCTAYKDLTFSLYYNNGSQQSSTGKSASELSINLTKAGKYVFTIYVTDAAGNPMYYYNPDWKEGDDEEEKVTEISTGNIWSMYTEDEDGDFADTRKYLPWFEFNVAASEISVENPEEQDIAYVGTTYSSISFEINGIDYEETYKLYVFDNEAYAKGENKTVLTYDEFLKRKEELLKNYRKYFTEIRSTNNMSSTDPWYDTYSDYAWNDTSPSFVPQENAFYVVTCTVKSTVDSRPASTAYMVISASDKVRSVVGEDTWVQDNMTSIILLAIAGASLIGIILLLVIKPKEKRDLDEIDLAEPKAKKKKK